MTTIGWLLTLVALILIRGAMKGRSLTDFPSDLGDMMVGAISGDTNAVRDVLARTGNPADSPLQAGTTGPASPPPSGAGPAISNAGLPVNNGTQARLLELGHVLKARGVRVGEGPGPFGPISRGHVKNSYHYRGLAFDLNYDGKKISETAYFDQLAQQLVAAGWRVIWRTKGHFDHIHVDAGPAGRVTL